MEDEATNRPKWLLELENRKRKPRLAHEAGAGAPCMNCNSACPGLDLHFWRKICKNCKCGRDDHDVHDDEFPQFDLLFGPSGKFKKKSMCLQVNNKKQNEGETTFEWVPPDTTKELVMDYMKALPAEKLPIKGSIGAALRRQLLQKQLPLHDIDHKVCDELSEQEQKQFEKYLENIKKYVGQGKVMKILGARPFDRSLMTPINATDMQRCNQQNKPYTFSTGVQLRTPSSFAVKVPYTKLPCETEKQDTVITNNDNKKASIEEYNCLLSNISVNGNIEKSQPVEGKFYDNNSPHTDNMLANEKGTNNKIINSSIPTHLCEQEIVPGHEMQNSVNYIPLKESIAQNASADLQVYGEALNNVKSYFAHSETVNDEAANIAESMLADALLPPSAIHTNDIIGSTLDKKGLMFIREKLTDKYNAIENLLMHATPKASRLLDSSDVLQPHSDGIKGNNNSANVNKNTERIANITAMKSPVGIAEKTETANTTSASLDVQKMHNPMSYVVQSTDTPGSINEQKQCSQLAYHKTINNELSVTNIPKVAREDALAPLINRHKSTNLASIPKLNPSLSQISSQCPVNTAPLQAELSNSVLQSTVIHSEQLQNPIFPHTIGDLNEPSQNAYVEHLKDATENLKISSTKQKCQKCSEDIHVGDVVVIAEKADNAFWHPGCFVCSVCSELLVDLVYFHYKNKLYCGRDLATFLGIPRCFACDELIFVREYTVAEGHNYHVKHFCCWDCDMPLAGQQYITENDRPLCLPCYQKTYAKTCLACNVIIAADQQGVVVKNLNFHATEACFCCYSCKKNLLNSRMAIKEDKLFCSKECITKFLKQ